MSLLTYIIIFSLIGGLFSLIGGVLLLGSARLAKFLARFGMPFAAGALLAAVFFDLLPEGIEQTAAETVLFATLAGIVAFYFAERFLRWFHHHHQHEKSDPAVPLLIAGDTIHNALDGVAIAAAFLVSIPTGIVTTIAVAAHEIPQEIGEFGVLLNKGMRRRKVLLVNVLSSLSAVVAAVATYWLGSSESLPVGLLLGLSAGFLLYIALSDIIPALHESPESKKFFAWQPIILVFGVLFVGLITQLAHTYVGHDDHDHTTSSVHEEDDDHDEADVDHE